MFGPRPNQAVSEWERMTPPPEVETASLLGATAAYNPTLAASNPRLGGYFAWAVGGRIAADTQGVAMRFNRYNWETKIFSSTGEPKQLKSVSTYLQDVNGAGAGTDDLHRVWAVGESRNTGQGVVVYSQTNSTTGTATPWDDCIGVSPSCDSIVFQDAAGNTVTPSPLNDIDFYNGTDGLAVGNNCEAWWTANGGRTWTRRPVPDGCTSTNLTGVAFARDFVSYNPNVDLNVPRTTAVWLTGASTANAWYSDDRGFGGFRAVSTGVASQTWNDVTAMYYRHPTTGTLEYSSWLAGDTGRIRRVTCTNPATCQATGFSDAGPSGEAGLGTVPLRSVAAYVDTTPPVKTMLWVSAGTIPPPTPPDGAIGFTLNPLAAASSVLWQSQSINTAEGVYGLSVVNSTHAWAVGDKGTLLKLSPGNVNGWLWIGADNCRDLCTASASNAYCSLELPTCQGGTARTRPLGWLSLNCANTGTCQAATFNYGVNIKQKKETAGVTTACSDANQDADVGALSGFGWFGASDRNQVDPDIPNVPPGNNVCDNNPDACRPIGWLSFERTYFCTGDLQRTCRQNSDCTGFGTCNSAGGTPPAPPFNTFNFTTACNKDITNNSPQQYVQALYDYATDRVEGWARFVAPEHLTNNTGWVKLRGPYMCGTAWCVKDRSRPCSPPATAPGPCAAGDSCDYLQTGAQPYGVCSRTTQPVVNPDTDTHYTKCTDCVTDPGADTDTADDFLKCSICTHVKTTDWWDAAYTWRQRFQVQMGATPGTAGATVSFLLNLDALPGIQANYDDVRVVYHTGTGFYELAREIVNFTPGIDPADEEIRFKLVSAIAPGPPDTNYYLYYANPAATAPAASLNNVYQYFEDFAIDVFSGATPWARSTGPGTSACNPGGVNVIQWSAGRLVNGTAVLTDCFAWNQNQPLDSTKNWNIEADVIMTTSAGGNPANIQSLHLRDTTSLQTGWWSALVDTPDGVSIWRSGGQQFPVPPPSIPVPVPVSAGPSNRMLWRVRRVDASNRLHDAWINGQQFITSAAEGGAPVAPATYLPGVHAWDTNAAWDDLRVWQALGETTSFGAFVAEPFSFTQKAVNPWSCNQCGSTGASGNTQCGTGRCIETSPDVAKRFQVCLNDEQCGDTTSDPTLYCSPTGRCSDTGAICFGDFAGVRTGFCNLNSVPPSTCRDAGENVCNECETCSLYGVSADTRGGALYGFGYSEDYGFVDFSFSFLYNRSWLQVLRGSIYSRSSVGSPTTGKAPGIGSPTRPETRCNATFVVRSNGSIANVCSSYQTSPPSQDPVASPYINPDSTELELPTQENQFSSEVGRVRINDLIDDPDGDGVIDEDGNGLNKFRQPVIDISNFTPSTWGFVNAHLGLEWLRNRVFYYHPATPRPFEFDVPATVKVLANFIGRGTFVFEGSNVIIEQDMAYDTSVSPATLRELASLGIMVIRDRAPGSPDVSVTIEKGVRRTVGNYYVEGMINIEGSATSAQPDDPYQNDGVMVARGFKFGRRIKGPIDNPLPSEIILNDGRLSLNPPPGFEGFSQNLPQIRESFP